MNLAIVSWRAAFARSPEIRNENRFRLAAAFADRSGGFRLYKHSHSWYRDTEFLEVWRRFPEAGVEPRIKDKQFAIWQLARSVSGLVGDTAECGVFRGAGSFLVLSATAGQERTHHIFDSFQGLSDPTAVDTPNDPAAHRWTPGELSVPSQVVMQNLRAFSEAVVLHAGWIPDRFSEAASCRFAFVYVDVDLYSPTIECFRFFYSRMVPGGLLVCDDYGFVDCPGARMAVDEFLADKPERVIHLTSGQGVVIKR